MPEVYLISVYPTCVLLTPYAMYMTQNACHVENPASMTSMRVTTMCVMCMSLTLSHVVSMLSSRVRGVRVPGPVSGCVSREFVCDVRDPDLVSGCVSDGTLCKKRDQDLPFRVSGCVSESDADVCSVFVCGVRDLDPVSGCVSDENVRKTRDPDPPRSYVPDACSACDVRAPDLTSGAVPKEFVCEVCDPDLPLRGLALVRDPPLDADVNLCALPCPALSRNASAHALPVSFLSFLLDSVDPVEPLASLLTRAPCLPECYRTFQASLQTSPFSACLPTGPSALVSQSPLAVSLARDVRDPAVVFSDLEVDVVCVPGRLQAQPDCNSFIVPTNSLLESLEASLQTPPLAACHPTTMAFLAPVEPFSCSHALTPQSEPAVVAVDSDVVCDLGPAEPLDEDTSSEDDTSNEEAEDEESHEEGSGDEEKEGYKECDEHDAKDSREDKEASNDKDEADEEDENNKKEARDEEELSNDESEDDEEEEDDEDDADEQARDEEKRSEKVGEDGSSKLNNSMELFSQTLSSLPLPNKVTSTPARAAPPRRSKFLSFMNDVPGKAVPLIPSSPQQLLGKTPTIEETGTYSLDWSSERQPHVYYQPDFIPLEAADVLMSMLSESVHFEYRFNESMHPGSNCKSVTKQPVYRPTSDLNFAPLDVSTKRSPCQTISSS